MESTPTILRVAYLDRDGTIVEHRGNVNPISNFKLIEVVIEGLLLLKDSLLLAVTYQSGIVKGINT